MSLQSKAGSSKPKITKKACGLCGKSVQECLPANSCEVQKSEVSQGGGCMLNNFKSRLTKVHHQAIRRSVKQGIQDMEEGRYEEYDEQGLRNLAKKLVAASTK